MPPTAAYDDTVPDPNKVVGFIGRHPSTYDYDTYDGPQRHATRQLRLLDDPDHDDPDHDDPDPA